jgi:hypothetical protein
MSVGQILFTNSRKNFVAGYVETRGRGRYENRKTLPAFYFNTQNAALKSVHYIRSGGQDTSLDLSYGGDDSEFGYRVWKESGIPAIANQDAIAYSTEKKELGQMLNEMKCFGSVNLHAIHQKHPELKDLFHFQWMESHSLKTRLIRLLMRESLVENIQKRVPVIPGFIRNPIIHFLVFLNIGIGYLSAKRF